MEPADSVHPAGQLEYSVSDVYAINIYLGEGNWRSSVSAMFGAMGALASVGYSEGAWTPRIAGDATAGTQTYSVQVGRYIRAGNLVTAWFRLQMTALDGATAGNVTIAGLPFASATVTLASSAGSISQVENIAHTGARLQFGVSVGPNETVVRFFEFATAAGGGSAQVQPAALSATSGIIGSLTYQAA